MRTVRIGVVGAGNMGADHVHTRLCGISFPSYGQGRVTPGQGWH
ncbi:hypothetical protein [Streptomyces diastatochromogenes]